MLRSPMGSRNVAVICLMVALATITRAQVKSTVAGQTFRNANIGVVWTFPDSFFAAAPGQVPGDPTDRDQIILALWNKRFKTPVPPVVLLWDTKLSPETLSPSTRAQRYLQSLKPGKGFKLSKPMELFVGGITSWRMDYWRPDDSGQSYNSAIAVSLKDRTLLFILMSASSQKELDTLVTSLHGLKFEAK